MAPKTNSFSDTCRWYYSCLTRAWKERSQNTPLRRTRTHRDDVPQSDRLFSYISNNWEACHSCKCRDKSGTSAWVTSG